MHTPSAYPLEYYINAPLCFSLLPSQRYFVFIILNLWRSQQAHPPLPPAHGPAECTRYIRYGRECHLKKTASITSTAFVTSSELAASSLILWEPRDPQQHRKTREEWRLWDTKHHRGAQKSDPGSKELGWAHPRIASHRITSCLLFLGNKNSYFFSCVCLFNTVRLYQ